MARPSRDAETMRQVVIDADLLGDEEAAKKHGINRRTVIRYRKAVRADPELSRAVAEEKAEVTRHWREELRSSRLTILDRVVALAQTSDSLFHVSGALKIVTDAENAEVVIEKGLMPDGGFGQPSAQPARPSGTVAEAPRRALALLGAKRTD